MTIKTAICRGCSHPVETIGTCSLDYPLLWCVECFEKHEHEGISPRYIKRKKGVRTMAQTCSICTHPERRKIETMLAEKGTLRKIAQRFAVSPWALHRHLKKCMCGAAQAAMQAVEVKNGRSILEQLIDIQRRTLDILNKAGEDPAMSLKAVAECRKNLELMAKLTGELDPSPKVAVALGVKIDFRSLTNEQLQAIVDGAEPHAVLAT